jgi:RHS repeat-associated protein
MSEPSFRWRANAVTCGSDRRWVSEVRVIWSLAITLLLLSGPTLSAQEIIDPKSGQLFLSVTDLTVQAGPVTLEVRRSLETGKRPPGLLGTRWRLNWDSRLLRAGPLVLIEDAGIMVQFDSDGSRAGYRTASGDRLAFDKDGRAIRTKPDRIKEVFDAQGRLVERDYRNGNRVVIHYSSEGRLAKIEGPRGSYLKFTADKAGRLTQVEASTTATIRYVYSNDNLTEVQRPPSSPIRYSYFTDGRLSRIEEPLSGAVEFAYDFKGRVMSRRWADGSKERYEYDEKASRLRYTDPVGAVTTTQWSQDKRREEVTDPLGRKSVLESDATGRPLSVTGPTGATSRLTYDALGRTVAVTDPLGRVTKLEYLGESSLIQAITQPGADRQVFEYDAHGNLTAIRVGSATVSALTYHPDGGLATTRGLDAPERRFSYHPDGRLKSIANALGETTQFEYDRRGNLIREVNPLGGVTVRSYDVQDRLVSLTNPVGGTTRYEYDAKGRLTKITDPSGGATRFEYDARGRLVAEAGPTGLVTKYEYDAAGREVKFIEPGNRITTRRYDALGNVTVLTDPLGRTTQFDYDQLGRLARERRPTGLEIAYRYDGLGNLLGSEDNAGAKSELQRDALGLLTSSVDPLGAVTRYQYDPLGNLVGLTDPAGHVIRYTYAQIGGLAGARLPSGDEGRYEYDAAGRLIRLHRPSKGVTRFAHDAMGNVATISDPLGNKRQHAYDLSGRLASATDAGGRVTGYIYDRSGRLAVKQLPDGRKVKYEYDALGNRLKADDGAFPVLYGYDQEGRLVRVEYPAIKKSVRYAYDSSGLRTKLIDAEGREVRYEYDSKKRLSAIVLPDGKRIALGYDLKDRLSSVQYPNGVTGQWEYDAAGRIVKIGYRDRDGKAAAGFTYRYDPAGTPVERQDSQGRTARFQHDSAGQLIEEVSPGGTTRYRYLPGGNRATVEERGTVTQYRYDADDRLVQAGAEQLTYDKNGNLIGRKGASGATVYEYGAEDQLVKVIGPDGGTTTFGYAPTSERVWKRDQQGLTHYLYDGFDLIEEVEEGGSLKATYVHGPGIDRPLAMIRDGKTYYYHTDHLGSVTHLTDEQGQIVAAYEYDPFGKMRDRHGSNRNPFTFTGREFDSSTGLYYYRARYYDATLGRFLTKDPAPLRMEEPLELNPYLYVKNNPIRFVDPLGLAGVGPGIMGSWSTPDLWMMVEGGDGSQREEAYRILRGRGQGTRALDVRFYEAPKPQPGGGVKFDWVKGSPPEVEGPLPKPPRTPTIKTQLPQAGQTGAVPRAAAPGSRTAAVPRAGAPAPGTPGPGGTGGGISKPAAGLIAVVMTAAQVYACYEKGLSPLQCATQMAVGLAVGGVIVAVVGPTGALILSAASGAISIGEGIVELNRDWEERKQRQQAEAARQAQQQANRKRLEEIVSKLETQIDGELAALRAQIAEAEAAAKGAAQAAATAATAAVNLLRQLDGSKRQIEQASAACKDAEMVRLQISDSAANAVKNADVAEAMFTGAGAMVDACQSKDELNTAKEAYEAAKKLASAAASNYKKVSAGNDLLKKILAKAESARATRSQASAVVDKIRSEAASAADFADTARTDAKRAEHRLTDLKTRKAAMLSQVWNVLGAFPPDFGEAAERVKPLVGRLAAEEPALTAPASANSAEREAKRAGEVMGQANAALENLNGLPLCEGISPADEAVEKAASAVALLGMGGMGEGFSGKVAACLAKLTPGQTPVTPAGGDTTPADPTLKSFAVSCSPSKIKVGQSSSCKAVGEYSTQPGVGVDLTHLAAWGPGPTIIGDWAGSWFAKASHGGKSATDTVTVIDDEKGPGPDIKGAGQQPFTGGIPPGTPTSGVTGGGKEPIPIPGQETGPTGAGGTGTAGQTPPQQGYWCYSEKTKEWYQIPYGPCPPSDRKPSGDPSVRIPWQGLTPPPDTVAPTGPASQCPPGCHIKPATGKCHCGGM